MLEHKATGRALNTVGIFAVTPLFVSHQLICAFEPFAAAFCGTTMPLPSSLRVVDLMLSKRRFARVDGPAMRTLVFLDWLVRRAHMSLQARPVAADVLALLAGEALGRRMPICDMCFKDASGPCSIRAISTLEAPRAGWIVYALMRSQVDYRYEPLSATRKRTFQNARVRSVLSGDVCLKVQLVRNGFPHSSHIGRWRLPSCTRRI